MNPGEYKRIVSGSIRVKLSMFSLQSPSFLCVLDQVSVSVSGDSEATHTGDEQEEGQAGPWLHGLSGR